MARLLLWSLPLAAALGALVAVGRARAEADLAAAADLLAQGRAAEARPLLEGHADSGAHGGRARAGLALAGALEGGDGAAALSSEDVRSFRPRLLMAAALHRGDFEACARLAQLTGGAGDPSARLYEAAARLEMGELDHAAALLAQVDEARSATGLGARVAGVLAARRAGATLTLADRQGRLVGHLDDEGTFHPEAKDAAWVPEAALDGARGRTGGVRLSADADLSAAALAALGPYRGSVVLVDVATGHVLAAVSDAKTRARAGSPGFDQLREPASIQKIITAVAALRAGRDPGAEISKMVCNGYQRYRGGTLWCTFPAGPLTGGLREAMAVSCNVAFANLAIALGWPAMVAELRRWGFGGAADTPGAMGRVLKTDGTERELASLGIGLDWTEMTPLHAALLGAAVASGAMPRPVLVAADDGALALSPRPVAAPAPRRILEPRWVALLQKALAGVVEEGGTAEGVAPPSFPVVMKTGTASAPGLGYHVNYVGAGPMPHPRIAFCVRVTHQPTSPRVGAAAREVLRALLAELGRRSVVRDGPQPDVS